MKANALAWVALALACGKKPAEVPAASPNPPTSDVEVAAQTTQVSPRDEPPPPPIAAAAHDVEAYHPLAQTCHGAPNGPGYGKALRELRACPKPPPGDQVSIYRGTCADGKRFLEVLAYEHSQHTFYEAEALVGVQTDTINGIGVGYDVICSGDVICEVVKSTGLCGTTGPRRDPKAGVFW
jgi:hypothetical protein